MKFFEVFDMLAVDTGLRDVFGEVVATKAAASKLTGNITVHIESARPLPYREKKRTRCQKKNYSENASSSFFSSASNSFSGTLRMI